MFIIMQRLESDIAAIGLLNLTDGFPCTVESSAKNSRDAQKLQEHMNGGWKTCDGDQHGKSAFL
jgi:hypothetical protein